MAGEIILDIIGGLILMSVLCGTFGILLLLPAWIPIVGWVAILTIGVIGGRE